MLTNRNMQTPWAAPNQPPLSIATGSVLSGATANIIAAGIGKIYLHTLLLVCQSAGAAACFLQAFGGSVGTVNVAHFDFAQIGAPNNIYVPIMPPFDFEGAPLANEPANASPISGLQILNNSAGTVIWTGVLTYSLYPIGP